MVEALIDQNVLAKMRQQATTDVRRKDARRIGTQPPIFQIPQLVSGYHVDPLQKWRYLLWKARLFQQYPEKSRYFEWGVDGLRSKHGQPQTRNMPTQMRDAQLLGSAKMDVMTTEPGIQRLVARPGASNRS